MIYKYFGKYVIRKIEKVSEYIIIFAESGQPVPELGTFATLKDAKTVVTSLKRKDYAQTHRGK